MLTPRQKTPDLTLPILGGGDFDPVRDAGSFGTLMVFYRGLHCPICLTQLRELEKHAEDLAAKGVSVVAISTDGQERAAEMARKAGLKTAPMAYGLSLQQAHDWGLFISAGHGTTSAGVEEPALFSEPGMFILRPDGTLYFSAVQSMPFTRPALPEILRALDFVIAKDYPARGEYTGALETAA
ncbi:MAG: peroxiredoxin-like family protein [Pseudomonadota bacterium]